MFSHHYGIPRAWHTRSFLSFLPFLTLVRINWITCASFSRLKIVRLKEKDKCREMDQRHAMIRWKKKKKKSLKAQWPSTEEQIQTVKVSERQWRKQNHVPRMSSCTYKQTDRLDVIVSRNHYSTINKCYVHPRFPFSLQAWLRDLKKKKRHFPSQSLPSYLDKSCAQHVQSINGGGVFRLFDSSCRFQIIIIKRGVTLSSQKKRKVRWQQTVALSKHTSKMVAMAMPVLEIAFAYTKWNTVVGCN